MWLKFIYVVTIYLCGYNLFMWLQFIYVVTIYLCGYNLKFSSHLQRNHLFIYFQKLSHGFQYIFIFS